MESLKKPIHDVIALYMKLKPILHLKTKTTSEKGEVIVTEQWVRASQHFNLRDSNGKLFDDIAAEKLLEETKQSAALELLTITKVILDETKNIEQFATEIKNLEADKDNHQKIFSFCLDKLVKLNIVSPYDTIDYELLSDKQGSLYGAKQIVKESNPEDLDNA